MKGKFDYFKYQRYNKKRKKPWRSLKRFIPNGEGRNMRIRKSLILFLVVEGAVISLFHGEIAGSNVPAFRLARQEMAEEKEVTAEAFWGRRTGETREQGVSFDWKEGTVKLWQKVERVILQGPD